MKLIGSGHYKITVRKHIIAALDSIKKMSANDMYKFIALVNMRIKIIAFGEIVIIHITVGIIIYFMVAVFYIFHFHRHYYCITTGQKTQYILFELQFPNVKVCCKIKSIKQL